MRVVPALGRRQLVVRVELQREVVLVHLAREGGPKRSVLASVTVFMRRF